MKGGNRGKECEWSEGGYLNKSRVRDEGNGGMIGRWREWDGEMGG